MLARYIGATLVLLGGAMLVAPDAPKDTLEEKPRRSASSEAAPTAPRPATAPAAPLVTVSLAEGAGAAIPRPAAQSVAPEEGTPAADAAPVDAPQAGDAAPTALALGLPDPDDAFVIPTLEEPATIQEASLTSETLSLIAIAEGRVTVEAPDAPDADNAEPAPVVLYVTGSRVNVRAGPSTGFTVISSVAFGDAVEVLADPGDGWAEIRLTNGDTGYMSRRFLEE
ncbi:MAG: SH3 domain-containing protein [Pseudomonadota bacterium]